MRYTVVVTDADFPDVSIESEVLERIDAELVVLDASTPEEVIRGAGSADALLTQYAPITDEVFRALSGLRVVGRYGIGVDTVDVRSASRHGVRVVNVPSYCVDEVSTHAISLLLACIRKVSVYDAAIAEGTWDWKRGRPIHRLRGSTLGLVGFGKIPRRLTEKVRGFDLEIVAYDPYCATDAFDEHGVEPVGFDELLARADVISVHTPLSDETRGLFDADAFTRMKSTATLVNTSRGPVVDDDALSHALDQGELAGAGLDVLPEEPPGDSPLLERDDVVLTPHVAWYAEESLVELRRTLAEDVARTLSGGEPENLVNREVSE